MPGDHNVCILLLCRPSPYRTITFDVISHRHASIGKRLTNICKLTDLPVPVAPVIQPCAIAQPDSRCKSVTAACEIHSFATFFAINKALHHATHWSYLKFVLPIRRHSLPRLNFNVIFPLPVSTRPRKIDNLIQHKSAGAKQKFWRDSSVQAAFTLFHALSPNSTILARV